MILPVEDDTDNWKSYASAPVLPEFVGHSARARDPHPAPAEAPK